MHSKRIRRVFGLLVLSGIIGSSSLLTAQSNKKSSPPPAKAAPAKAAPPKTGSAPGGVRSSATGSGPTAGHPTGPTANHHTGPTTSNPVPGTSVPHPPPKPNGGIKDNGGRDPLDAGRAPTIKAGTGHTVNVGLGGKPASKSIQLTSVKGGEVQRDVHGRVTDVHDARSGTYVHNGLSGRRIVSAERPDGSRVFAERGRPGYIQHPYNFHGQDFARRSYYYHGRAYERFYRPYTCHRVSFDVYAPRYYYGPGFYGWAYNPWYQPVVYGWGWGGAPWVGYYGFYFAPAPVYPSAAFWLADYMISQDLAANYQAAQDAGAVGAAQSSGGGAVLTPEVKQQIADEVKYQIATESQEAQQNGLNPDLQKSSITQLLTDGQPHTFVTGGDLDVVDSSGSECALSGGDVLELTTPPASDAQAADLVVLASKGGQECAKSDTVTVAFADLQEMQNHMRETIDQGMQDLQSKQGTGGLPGAPPSARTPPVETAFAQQAPPPDPNGAAEVSQQLQQGDAVAQTMTAEVQQGGGGPGPGQEQAAPVNIALGQSIAQVTVALGQPVRIVDLGTKKIYQYTDMKIVFKDGKVTDVQ